MLGFSKSSSIADHEATGEIERVYYEITQSLRIRGLNLIFRSYAAQDDFLPAAWDALRPTVETVAFEHAADQVRTAADVSATGLGALDARNAVPLGASQAWHIERIIQLYRYANPKLLVFAALVRRLLGDEFSPPQSSSESTAPKIERGPPPEMLAMEMVDESPSEPQLQQIFQDIQSTLSLQSVNSDYRSLALWPDYLAAVWLRLKPAVGKPEYAAAADRLRDLAKERAAALPLTVQLSDDQRTILADNRKHCLESTERFEHLLPGLILNVALIGLDWLPGEAQGKSPYPAANRPASAGGAR